MHIRYFMFAFVVTVADNSFKSNAWLAAKKVQRSASASYADFAPRERFRRM